MLVGAVVALAQVYQYHVDGRFNLVLAGIFTVLAVLGAVGLLAVKNRRAAVIGAVAMVCAVGAAFCAVYFVRAAEQSALRQPIDNPPSSSGASISSSPSEVTSSSPAATSATTNTTTTTTTTTSTTPPVVADDPRGFFEYPVDNQEVTGSTLPAKGRVENVSSELLCIVKDESGNHFPYTASASGGSWNAGTGIGPKKTIDRPYTFTMILATATTAALDEIRRQRENSEKYNNEGVGRQLPAGISQLATVQIQRTS